MIGICGASGYIGQALCKFLKDKRLKVLGTYCRNHRDGLFRFDLTKDKLSIFDSCDFVVILSAYCKIRFCDENRVDAYELNVWKTKELLQYLSDKGIPALFVSSDAAETMDTVYGQYKRLVEKFIQKNWINATWIRPGKVTESNIEALCKEIYAHIKPGRRQKATA